MVCPFLKAVSRSETVFTWGGSPRQGDWFPSALCTMPGQAQDALDKAETSWNQQMGRTAKWEGPFPQDIC